MAAEESLFGLTRLVSASDIRLSARCENGRSQMLAFVTGSGHLTLHYVPSPDVLPTLKVVNWFLDTTKRISAMTFDPSGAWLLVAGNDGVVYVVPALTLVNPSSPPDHRWSNDDITSFPTSLRPNRVAGTECRVSRPTAVAWWQCGTECQHLAIVGTDRGDIVFVSLTAGVQVGSTAVKSPISSIHVCQDNCLDNVFLLITGEQRTQWKLHIEQRTTGYIWPLDNVGKSSDNSNTDGEVAVRATALPTARSRLQGLKQLSVEKLANMRQRLAEARSKGSNQKEVRVRRGSNGSSSDESQRARKTSTSSDGSDWAGTGPTPTKLSPQVGETYLQPQYARGLYLLSGFYAPSSILTIHGMALEIVPLFVHKLAPMSRDVLVTDRFLFVTDDEMQKISVVSCQFAESRLDGDTDFNPDSVVDSFVLADDERVVGVYKRTSSSVTQKRNREGSKSRDSNRRDRSKSRSRERSRSKERTQFVLPKTLADLNVEDSAIDGCVVVTSAGVYEISLRRPAVEMFMDLVLQRQELEKAERLAVMFGLDLLKLLESAGDLKLAEKQFAQAISLYKLSRCRHLKSVLKFAAAGHSRELLTYVDTLFGAANVDVSPSERIHLANLAVMAHTDQVLRAVNKAKLAQVQAFLRFLRDNPSYDPALAVTICGQAGRWDALALLSGVRGLRPEVLDVLARILRTLLDSNEPIDRDSPALDADLWRCLADPGLLQCLLTKPAHCAIVLRFVGRCLPLVEEARLAALATMLDPSAPELRPLLKRVFTRRRRFHSAMSSDSLDAVDAVENGDDPCAGPAESMAQAFLLVSLRLAQVRAGSGGLRFDDGLVARVSPGPTQSAGERQALGDAEVPLRASVMAAGFCHAALVRNSGLFAWGNTVCGCLGTGPALSRYLTPQQVTLLPALKLEVLGVSCGRQHTLALTNNGVYAWGSNQFGQLGLGGVSQTPWPALVRGLAGEPVVEISAGQYHSMALTRDGRAFTWGWGVHGQLGHASAEDVLSPALVPLGQSCVRIAAGHAHSLLLLADGTLMACGAAIFGQLGRGTNTKSSVPVVVEIDEKVVDIATGYFHSLALTESHRLVTWGASPQVLRLQAQAQKKARLMQAHFAQQSEAASPGGKPAASPDVSPEKPVSKAVASTAPDSPTPAPSEADGSPTATHPRHETTSPLVTSSAPSIQEADAHLLVDGGSEAADDTGCNDADVFAELDERPLAKKSFAQSVQDYFSEHKGTLDGSTAKKPPPVPTELAELNQKKKGSPVRPTQGGQAEKSSPESPPKLSQGGRAEKDSPESPPKLSQGGRAEKDSPETPTRSSQSRSPMEPSAATASLGEMQSDAVEPQEAVNGVPSIVISPSLDDKDVKKATQAAKRNALRSLLLEDSNTAHLSPREVDTSLVVGKIAQIACGCHHSVLLSSTGAVFTWGRSLDGQLGTGSRREVVIPTALPDIRASQVACGCEFTLALDGQSGKVWAWGSNCSAQLGNAPIEDSKSVEGKMLVIKTMKRVIKLPHGSQNSIDLPREVPRLPTPAISFRQIQREAGTIPEQLARLSTLDHPPYGQRSLHYVMQRMYGHYDTNFVLEKCVEFGNHQAAAKLSLLERNFHVALTYQLKALSLSEENRKETGLDKTVDGQSDSVASTPSHDVSEIHLFSIQGGNEEMSEGRQDLTSPSDTASSMSQENSSSEIDKMVSPSANEGVGIEVVFSDANDNRDPISTENADVEEVSPAGDVDNQGSVPKLDGNENGLPDEGFEQREADKDGNEHHKKALDEGNGITKAESRFNRKLVTQACQIVDFYVGESEEESHSTMSRLLQRVIEFWMSEDLPASRLEELLDRHMDKFFYPLGLLLFNNSNGTSAEPNPAAFLNHLSTRFCLRLCSTLLTHIDQGGSHAEVVCLVAPGVGGADADGAMPGPEQLVAAILNRLGAGAAPCVVLADQVVNGCIDDRLFVFSCGHSFGSDEMRRIGGITANAADCPPAARQMPADCPQCAIKSLGKVTSL